ncbi:hypothetical protein C8J57DRAFT_460594 [Mycena rebaudengoi]|nr:hypothetical protein C8J57DRAFT_460594 [Mycena rebaudengoi]
MGSQSYGYCLPHSTLLRHVSRQRVTLRTQRFGSVHHRPDTSCPSRFRIPESLFSTAPSPRSKTPRHSEAEARTRLRGSVSTRRHSCPMEDPSTDAARVRSLRGMMLLRRRKLRRQYPLQAPVPSHQLDTAAATGPLLPPPNGQPFLPHEDPAAASSAAPTAVPAPNVCVQRRGGVRPCHHVRLWATPTGCRARALFAGEARSAGNDDGTYCAISQLRHCAHRTPILLVPIFSCPIPPLLPHAKGPRASASSAAPT